MALGIKPENNCETRSILWQYADDCWYRCGDKSNDINYYSKRMTFLFAYVSTELFMLTDKSTDFN